jgi:hypothetical protein
MLLPSCLRLKPDRQARRATLRRRRVAIGLKSRESRRLPSTFYSIGRNVISANDRGIQIDGASAINNAILGNSIGTNLSGQSPLGNEIDGVLTSGDASNNTIGGTGSGDGNTIPFNTDDGVLVSSGHGDAKLPNAIFSNGLIGISLGQSANDSMPLDHLDWIVIDGRANSLLNSGLTDASGDLLADPHGVIGAHFVATIGAEARLAYTDGAGNAVTLRLTRGALMELFQLPDGTVHQLALVGTIPNKRILTATVRHKDRSGRTVLPPMMGSAGVRIRLNARAFAMKAVSATVANSREPSAPLASSG